MSIGLGLIKVALKVGFAEIVPNVIAQEGFSEFVDEASEYFNTTHNEVNIQLNQIIVKETSDERLTELGIPQDKRDYVVFEAKKLLEEVPIIIDEIVQTKDDRNALIDALIRNYKNENNIEEEEYIRIVLRSIIPQLIGCLQNDTSFLFSSILSLKIESDKNNITLEELKKQVDELVKTSQNPLPEPENYDGMDIEEAKFISWERYKKDILIKACSTGLYDTQITLDDIYVEPMGSSVNVAVIDKSESLHKQLLNWCQNKSAEAGKVCLIEGDPGSGKSSLLKEVAKDLAQKDEKVLFLEFYKLAIKTDKSPLETIKEKISKYNWCKSKNTILILDGLDEIRNDPKLNATKLLAEIWDETFDGFPFKKMIISGRCTIFDAIESYRYQLITFFVEDLCGNLPESLRYKDLDLGSRKDCRKELWNKLAAKDKFDLSESLLEQVIGRQKGTETNIDYISRSPLLLFLLTWTLNKEPDVEKRLKLVCNVNSAGLYQTMTECAVKRKSNRERGKDAFTDAEYAQFIRILQTIGAAAWMKGRREIALKDIKDYCEIMDEMNGYNSCFVQNKQGRQISPYLHFFAHAKNEDSQDSEESEFVFLHKSFYEYLAAEEIKYRLDKASSAIGKDNESLQFRRLQFLLGEKEVDTDVYDFLTDLAGNPTSVSLADVINLVKLAIRSDNSKSYEEYAKAYQDDKWSTPDRFDIYNRSKTTITNLNLFHTYIKETAPKPDLSNQIKFSSGLLKDCYFKSINVSEYNFNGVTLNKCVFSGKCTAMFYPNKQSQSNYCAGSAFGSSFAGSKWEESYWTYCIFANCNFIRANIYEAFINASEFGGSIFEKSILQNVDAQDTCFFGCVFSNFKIMHEATEQDGTPLKFSVYNCCDFSRAIMKDGTFKNLTFRYCTFENAEMHNIKFENCIFRRCNFIGVKHENSITRTKDTCFTDCTADDAAWEDSSKDAGWTILSKN